jgi:uncharacterized protein
MNFRLKLFLTIGMFASLTVVHAASFDCAKASAPTEKMICQNPSISKLDDRLSEAYKEVRKIDTSVVEEQRAWLKEARTCADERCLEKAYGVRVDELEKRLRKQSQSAHQPANSAANSVVAWCLGFLNTYSNVTANQPMDRNHAYVFNKYGPRVADVYKRWKACMGNDSSEAKNAICRKSLGPADQEFWETNLIASSKAKEAFAEGGITRLKANVELKCGRLY